MRVLNIDFRMTKDSLEKLLGENPECGFVHFTHEHKLGSGENLITESRKNKNSRDLLLVLANHGFYLYMTREDFKSSFVQHKDLPKLWKPVATGEYIYNEDGLVYSLHNPKGRKPRNLLVIFSSMSGPIYMSSLMRMFTQNFSTIGKYIPQDTAILRIADLGGVVGAYYLNNKYLPNNEENILKLIRKIAMNLSVDKTVLFGVSKGGTAALVYSLLGGYDCLASDPILDDEYYVKECRDLHFVQDTFYEEKIVRIKRLFHNINWEGRVQRQIITSYNSPQHKYIKKLLLDDYDSRLTIYLNNSSLIKSHPDVARESIHIITMALNLLLNNVVTHKGYNEVL